MIGSGYSWFDKLTNTKAIVGRTGAPCCGLWNVIFGPGADIRGTLLVGYATEELLPSTGTMNRRCEGARTEHLLTQPKPSVFRLYDVAV